ncbi:HK97 gp10 family phage protein [Macrococcoides goetzii]|uniref:HK97 gp10 family phage protein n=1 Tax=Macrococcoides goetzii TaxID=1891097 RepID=A0A2G5NV26_9STAP|nr:HK97-gp10 family putative phage morphogenesis protein [Macrococcus goetzii]RAI79670.1 HK97 gp10 family phage protein [Macrococcus goetzii]
MKDLVIALDYFGKDVEDWAKKGVAKTIMEIYNTALSLAATDTGFLRQSIDFKISNGGLKGVVSVGAEYAIYVEFGTGIYATQGSKAKKIPWVYQSPDGEWVTTYGSPPQPFWMPALDAGEKVFRDYFS